MAKKLKRDYAAATEKCSIDFNKLHPTFGEAFAHAKPSDVIWEILWDRKSPEAAQIRKA